jgi:ATP-dependent RNA helicase DHX37/DHR1
MERHKPPEITYLPLHFTVLQMTKMGIQNVLKFPFPTKPNESSLISSINELLRLEAVQKLNDQNDLKVTELGEALSYIPIEPKYSKMLLRCRQGWFISWIAWGGRSPGHFLRCR